MVRLKKQIAIILIFSLFLSLAPNFLYTGNRDVFAEDEDSCKDFSCPAECPDSKPVYDDRTNSCSCINCSITCQWKGEEVTNFSCRPLEEGGEWVCGVEIPIGEVLDRTTFLARKMLDEFGGIIEKGGQMAKFADATLTDYKKWNCAGYTDWEGKESKCETDCDKRYRITAGILQPGQSDPGCETETNQGKGIYPKECNEDYNQCIPCAEYCAREEYKEECCWIDNNSQPNPNYDPEYPEEEKEYLSCKYCKKEDENETKYCYEYCSARPCMGCCGQYFWPVINGYTGMEELQEVLKNDIREKTPEGEDLPESFKFKRSYILEQLEFSRCELAQCWIPGEDYPDVLAGKKVGKHLLTCEQASQLGLFDDDQINCFVYQITDEWETIIEIWKEPKEHWWQWPVLFFETLLYVGLLPWRIIWYIMKDWTKAGQEKGCYPTNYYCCQF